MNKKVVMLAAQLLDTVERADVEQLIVLLQYYNRFPEGQRTQAMMQGSREPANRQLEEQIKAECRSLQAVASQTAYVLTNTKVCKCCGR